MRQEGKGMNLARLSAVKRGRGLLFSLTPEIIKAVGIETLVKEMEARQEEGLPLC